MCTLISLKFLRCLRKLFKKKNYHLFFLKTQRYTVSADTLVDVLCLICVLNPLCLST